MTASTMATGQELLKDPNVQAAIEKEVQKRLKSQARPMWLQETFSVNCPVHELMFLPKYVKLVVDTPEFQRMRHIKQLGVCSMIFPGATHNRFFHSIGTAYLAMTFIQALRHHQPELCITDRDEICVTLAGLCHDLGHPAFSHMFEHFLRQLGKEKREAAGKLSEEQEKEIQKFEKWDHEQASVVLVRKLLADLRDQLVEAGLKDDHEGNDWKLIEELIEPPKKQLRELTEKGELRKCWDTLLKGRPVDKAWMYEIVSNWRTGIDVDKFDYFRRDALHLGLQRQYDHGRYIKSARVILDKPGGVPTISPPEKDRDNIRENLMELRKHLHRTAYQHKTVKKLEQHMIDILKLMDEVPLLTGSGGKKMTISEAAITIDAVAYPKLTDIFVESRLLDREEPRLEKACDEYKARFLERKLMRMPICWSLPNPDENQHFKLPEQEKFLQEVLEMYNSKQIREFLPQKPWHPVPIQELRFAMAELHYGMASVDPILMIVFHDKQYQTKEYFGDPDANPHRRKLHIFWNPPVDRLGDDATLWRLTSAVKAVADACLGDQEPDVTPSSPMKPKRTSGMCESSRPLDVPAQPAKKKKRKLELQSSCPDDVLDRLPFRTNI